MIGRIYKYILDYIRSKDFLTQKIWKLKIEKKVLPITYDLTSLVLKKSFNLNVQILHSILLIRKI